MPKDAPPNGDAPAEEHQANVPVGPRPRVSEMQANLHRWAVADPGRQFDDLLPIVMYAWEAWQVGVTTDTRARMITSAALLLREHGVSGTSIPKVLAHSNGPRGSVGHHFPGGRIELITEALTWASTLVTDALARKSAAGATPSEVFAFLCDFYAKQLASTEYAAGCPVGAAAQEAFGDPALGPVVAGILDSWTAALTESMVASGHPETEAGDLALLCVCALEGAILVARVQKSTQPIDTVHNRLRPLL